MMDMMQRHVERIHGTWIFLVLYAVPDIVAAAPTSYAAGSAYFAGRKSLRFKRASWGIPPSNDGDRKTLEREEDSLIQGRSMMECYPKQILYIT